MLVARSKDILGLYDPVTRTLFVRAGSQRRNGLLRQLVHALQDQSFFLELENQFPYTTGLRFVVNLHNLGGNQAIFSALRQFPTTTEQILHVDAFLAREPGQRLTLAPSAGGLALQHSDTFGELDVRALLAVFQVPRLDEVGDRWGGGRTAIYWIRRPRGGRRRTELGHGSRRGAVRPRP